MVMLPVSAHADKARELENACYDSKGNVAVSVCTSAIEAAPSHSPDESIALNLVYAHRGDAYEDLGQYALARQDLSSAIALSPNVAGIYANRAIAEFNERDYSQAWADVDASRRLGGTVPQGFVDLLQRASPR